MATSSFHGVVFYLATLSNEILASDAAGNVMRRVDGYSDHEAMISPHGHFSSFTQKDQPKERMKTLSEDQPKERMKTLSEEQPKVHVPKQVTHVHVDTTNTTVTTTTTTEYDDSLLSGFRLHLMNCATGDCVQIEGDEILHMATCRKRSDGVTPVKEQLFIARGHTSLRERLPDHHNNVTLGLNGRLLCNTGAYEVQVDDKECHPEFADVSLVMKHGTKSLFTVQWNETAVGADGVKKILQNQCLLPAATEGSQHVDLTTDCTQEIALWTTDDTTDNCP
jgi:hypothetical protein